ncbi:MAG: urea amidolyase, partial [Micrococcaceae bacterium]|nr:urea amidolyase [Micrococcaceae bacterium]
RLWDLDRESPALIRAGDTVRFRPVRDVAVRAVAPGSTTTDGPTTTTAPEGAPTPEAVGAGTAAAATAPEKTAQAKTPTPGLLVLDAGLQATVQDLGRPGFADLGVTASGALDQRALRRANRLAGNPPEAAGLELLAGGFRIQALQDQVLAVTGAVVPLQITAPAPTAASATRTGARTAASAARSAARPRKAPLNAPFALLAGETLTWGAPTAGLRSYLAVRGGLDVAPVLGSRATDTLSGIGPPPLQRDTTLAVLAARAGSVVGRPEPAAEPPTGVQVLRLVPGPRADWFSPEAVEQFCSQEWTVSQQSNRIGLRLSGTPVERSRTGELASEGTVQGAVQIPSGGQPVLFLADHPVTGGYPVIGVVAAADLDLAAQLAPGTLVRFQVVADRPDLSQRSSMPDPGRAPSPHRPEPSPKQGNTHA